VLHLYFCLIGTGYPSSLSCPSVNLCVAALFSYLLNASIKPKPLFILLFFRRRPPCSLISSFCESVDCLPFIHSQRIPDSSLRFDTLPHPQPTSRLRRLTHHCTSHLPHPIFNPPTPHAHTLRRSFHRFFHIYVNPVASLRTCNVNFLFVYLR